MTNLVDALIAAYQADDTGVTEVQTVTIAGTLTGGSFKVFLPDTAYPGGPPTIAYNANLVAIQAAYDTALGGSGMVTIAGSVKSHTIQYIGLPDQRIRRDYVQFDISNLTGATGIGVARTVPGRGALLDLTTGIYQGIARNATFDYVTLSTIAGGSQPVYDRGDGDHPLNDGEVTFTVWSNHGGEAADEIANALILKFLNHIPELDRGKITNVILARPPVLLPQVATDDDGNSVCQLPVSFKYYFEW